MKIRDFIFLFFAAFFLSSVMAVFADDASTPSSSQTSTAAGQTSVTQIASPTPNASHSESMAKALVIHKPMPSPSWGKLIQYHREQILALSEKNRETLYEFVFQDDQGIVRTAIFHENSSGDGYWEVWVWDQP